jgi:hypothetical protein
MGKKDVPSDEWVQLIAPSFEQDYTIVIEDTPIYVYPGDQPARPVAGIPFGQESKLSGQLDSGIALWGRSQTDTDASVRVVPNLRIEETTERNVTFSAMVETDTYERGDDFDSTTYPINVDPEETIHEIFLSIVNTEVDVEITTTEGDVVTLPVAGESVINSFTIDSFTIDNPNSAGERTAGGWAGD